MLSPRALLAAIVLAPCAQAAVSLDAANTTWAGSTQVTYQGGFGGSSLYTGNEWGANYDPSYHGAALTMSLSPTMYGTFLQSTQWVNGNLQFQSELAGSNLSSGTSVHLSYTGLSRLPGYVVVIGGGINGYTYDKTNGTLSIDATTGALAQTGSNNGPGSIQQGFAVIISTVPTFAEGYDASVNYFDFGGSVFRTNAYWGDLANMVNYGAGGPLVGLNVNGLNGSAINFDAYLSLDFISSIATYGPGSLTAYVQKANSAFEVALMTTLYTTSGYNPHLDGVFYDTFGGQSVFDINGRNADGSYLDDVILASYSNSSWSVGNIGLIAIPEPSTYGLSLAALALAGAMIRRRRATKA